MIKECIQTARTVDEAIELACAKLEIPREEVEIEILELPKKGFLGIGNTGAKVRVYKEEHDKIGLAVEYVQTILDDMGLAGTEIKVIKDGDNAILNLEGEGLGVIIGRRGETLDALQYLTGLVANRIEGDYVRISIDSGNYREKREKTLEALARKIAITAVKTGRSSTLEPMNPYERRIIHAAVSQITGATSTSIGEEPNRKVVISSANARKYDDRPRSGGYSDRKPRQGGSGSGYKKPYQRTDSAPKAPVQKPAEPAIQTAPKPDEAVGDKPLYSKITVD